MVHNLLLRGINSIYLQCVNVERKSPESIPDFVNYVQQWGLCLREHHDNEEEFFFPEIEKFAGAEGIMAANVAQHAAFHEGLEAFMAYVDAVKAGGEAYSGARLRGLIDSFLPVLREHLRDEIRTLVALEKYEDRGDWAAWMKTTQAVMLKKTQKPDTKVSHYYDSTLSPPPPLPPARPQPRRTASDRQASELNLSGSSAIAWPLTGYSRCSTPSYP